MYPQFLISDFNSQKSFDRLVFFGEKAICNVVLEYLAHNHTERNHTERNHQGLDHELIVPLAHAPDVETEVKTSERLGGLLRTYRRAA